MLFFQEPNSDKVDKIVQTMLDLTLRHNKLFEKELSTKKPNNTLPSGVKNYPSLEESKDEKPAC